MATYAGMPVIDWNVDSFGTHALKAGRFLRQVHDTGDPSKRRTFLMYLDEYLGTREPTEEQFDGLYVGGLPEAIIDAALERRQYENFHSGINKVVRIITSQYM